MVASGAQPTSVMFNEIPVIASEKAVVKIPIIAPIPVRAIPNLIPPSRARDGFTLKNKAITVNTMVINGAAPKLIRGVNTLLAISIIVFICFSFL